MSIEKRLNRKATPVEHFDMTIDAIAASDCLTN